MKAQALPQDSYCSLVQTAPHSSQSHSPAAKSARRKSRRTQLPDSCSVATWCRSRKAASRSSKNSSNSNTSSKLALSSGADYIDSKPSESGDHSIIPTHNLTPSLHLRGDQHHLSWKILHRFHSAVQQTGAAPRTRTQNPTQPHRPRPALRKRRGRCWPSGHPRSRIWPGKPSDSVKRSSGSMRGTRTRSSSAAAPTSTANNSYLRWPSRTLQARRRGRS